MSIVIEASRCPQNHPCPLLRICPTGAISQKGVAAPTLETAKCINCGNCVRSCGFGAFASRE